MEGTELTTARLERAIRDMNAANAMQVASDIECHPDPDEATRLQRKWALECGKKGIINGALSPTIRARVNNG